MLKKLLAKLNSVAGSKDQEKLAIIEDINRRGFLKQILQLTLFAALSNICCGESQEYNQYLPDMGDSDRTNLSQREAAFLGQKIMQNIHSSGNMLDDYDVLDYLNTVGNDLVGHSPDRGRTFQFFLLNERTINAFALPGGYICINNGLIYTTRSEAELTSVMAHEIGHVVQHHIFRNIAGYNRNRWVGLAGILSGVLMATVNPAAAALAINSSQGLAMQNMLENSRDFEREADRMGQTIMYRARYDPHAMPEFFKRLKDTNKFNDNEAYAFLRTHPVTSERISEAETRANQIDVGKTLPDSPSFLLIREKCRVYQLGALEAVGFYAQALKLRKYNHIDTQYYGLAFAEFLQHKNKLALSNLNKIKDPMFRSHPVVINLKAQVEAENHNYKAAEKLYQFGTDLYPNYKGLWLEQSKFYIKTKQYKKAEQELDRLSQVYRDDIDIWGVSADLYSDYHVNNRQKYHYALGNKLYLLGKYKQAMVQFELALKVKKHSDAVLNDVISAKILKTRMALQRNLQYGGE